MTDSKCCRTIPKLKIAVVVVGTRGDVQPFLALCSRLQEYGHSVRLATHSNFEGFVKSNGVDFYPLAGDPRILAQYWVKARSIFPPVIKDLSRQRQQLKAIIHSVLPACSQPDQITGEPFTAEAIIANPFSFGIGDVSEALGVPVHILFIAPWTPTDVVPSPFLQSSQIIGNRLSYDIVHLLIWWMIRGFINELRKNELGLSPIGLFNTAHISLSNFPIAYMWSNHLLLKPNDWGPLIDVVGYCSLDLVSQYDPPIELVEWMRKGSKPIYFGFGSMPLKDSERVTRIILDTLKNTARRGIINRGWGNLGTHPNIPEDVFLLADCPHDWLFPQCSAVVHHGGAGTTAAGLKAGCPTLITPFLLDQFMWGDIVFQKGVGPAPIPISQLTVETLSEAITFMLQHQVKSRALELAELMKDEDGVGAAVEAFHQHLPDELPLSIKEDENPNPLQLFFGRVGILCCKICVSLG